MTAILTEIYYLENNIPEIFISGNIDFYN